MLVWPQIPRTMVPPPTHHQPYLQQEQVGNQATVPLPYRNNNQGYRPMQYVQHPPLGLQANPDMARYPLLANGEMGNGGPIPRPVVTVHGVPAMGCNIPARPQSNGAFASRAGAAAAFNQSVTRPEHQGPAAQPRQVVEPGNHDIQAPIQVPASRTRKRRTPAEKFEAERRQRKCRRIDDEASRLLPPDPSARTHADPRARPQRSLLGLLPRAPGPQGCVLVSASQRTKHQYADLISQTAFAVAVLKGYRQRPRAADAMSACLVCISHPATQVMSASQSRWSWKSTLRC